MSTEAKICGIASEVTGVPAERIAANPASLNGRIDSLDLTEIILEVEEQFDVIIDHEEDINGIDDLIAFVNAAVA